MAAGDDSRDDAVVARAGIRRRSLFYDAVALGLTAYARLAFRVRALNGEALRLEPETLLIANHPSEADVPVAVAALYRQVHTPGREKLLVHFALRDDLHTRGFFAGMPPGLPFWARRLLHPVGVGPVLRRMLPTPPIRSATQLLVVDLLRARPDAELEAILVADDVADLRARALGLGRTVPRTGRETLKGLYADLLWRPVHADDPIPPLAEEVFAERRAAARRDFERFVRIVRSGGVLLLSPEGRRSPDGGLQPLRRGAGLLVRRARPARVWPLGIAYDPLTRGRPWAYVGVGEPTEPPRREPDRALHALLARTVPLTVGQVVADALDRGERDGLERRLAAEVERALDERRPLDPALRDRAERRARLGEALAVADEQPERLPPLLAAYRSAR